MTATLIIIQLIAGFIVAMLGMILALHMDIWTGLLIASVGIFFVLRAGYRINTCN